MADPRSLTSRFHQQTKQRQLLPADESKWPEEWKTISYKTYERLKRIPLQQEEKINASLITTLDSRRTSRSFSQNPVTLSQWSTLLRHGVGITNASKELRAYPSAGGRFPLETYLIIFQASSTLPAGIYHYAVDAHALNVLLEKEFSSEEKNSLFTYPWAANAAAALFFAACFHRTEEKYGDRGYRSILLEAGHAGQNVHLLARALNLSCCSLAGTHDEKIEQLLGIDGVTESLVYALLLG